MAEIIRFPVEKRRTSEGVVVNALKGGQIFRHLDQILSNPENYSFEVWKKEIQDFLALKSVEVETHMFNFGFSVFSHPQMTPEFSRDLMLHMARSENYALRERLRKHLSQYQIKLPPEYLAQVNEVLEMHKDGEIDGLCDATEDRVNEVMSNTDRSLERIKEAYCDFAFSHLMSIASNTQDPLEKQACEELMAHMDNGLKSAA